MLQHWGRRPATAARPIRPRGPAPVAHPRPNRLIGQVTLCARRAPGVVTTPGRRWWHGLRRLSGGRGVEVTAGKARA
jgi:hypothetical protein